MQFAPAGGQLPISLIFPPQLLAVADEVIA
jgi:hypothetical protein